MAEIIEEIPIEPASAAAPEEIQEEIQEDIQENQPTIPEKKGRGRPAGSKNKPKEAAAKPKAKAKAKAKRVEYEYDDEEDYDDEAMPTELPPPRRAALRRPTATAAQPLDRHTLAAEVLDLLQQQRYSRASARRDHYASWFANM
jgi:hypothetical protein